MKAKTIILGIESSCDETAAAVMADGREILSNVIASQISIHKAYGGVVPEIASRHHLTNINTVIDQALEQADTKPDEIDAVGVTYGPGLIGALLIGLATAKALALALDVPLVGVNHIHGHISANYIEHPDLEPPFMSLIVSGGHTNLVEVSDYNTCRVLGSTRDDAAGEAFDKVARIIGLPYPGGPMIDKLARQGDAEAIHFKRVYLERDSYDFSFSGIKTAVLNYVHHEGQLGRRVNQADVAASFQQAVLDVLVDKAMQAVTAYHEDKLVVAGGVAANSRLREMLTSRCEAAGIRLVIPSPALCTDNAAMIGCAAYYKYKAGETDGLDLDAVAGLTL